MQVLIQFFKEMSPVRLAATGLTALTFLILFAIYLAKINSDEFQTLYYDLDLQDSSKIVQELDARRIPYEATDDGSTIKVHKTEVVKARLELAQVGLPTTGSVVGYEVFDKDDSIGATNFSQNVKLLRALEGELSRTISAFEEVDKSRVHLVMPQREIFSKDRADPRASIIVRLKGNKRLSKSQIDAMTHLVVTAVPNLDISNVTIVDTKGNALKIGSSSEEGDLSGAKNEELRIAEEMRIKRSIESLLERTFGEGKVKATVALDMNFDRTVSNSEIYDPDSAVIRSVQSIDEREQTPILGAEGDVSVANNIPGGGGDASVSSKFAITEKSDSTTNYEISKTIKNHISETGIVNRMSIGILVDGTYIKDEEAETRTYVPRSDEDLGKIKNLVMVGVGFDEDRGDKIEVVNMQFSSDFDDLELEPSDWIREELPNLFQTLIFAIVVLLVLITVIRPIALKAFEVKKANELFDGQNTETVIGPDGKPVPVATLPEGFIATGASSIPGSNQEVSENAVTKINELSESSPQDLVNVLRKWMNEGN